MASDKRFVAGSPSAIGWATRSIIYLEFDGFDVETHLAIRGRDLRESKERALDNCAEAGLTVTLVAAIEKDLNEHEIWPVVRHGDRPPSRCARSRSGRSPTRVGTHSDVLHVIADQLPQWFRTDDSSPCRAARRPVGRSPTCSSMAIPTIPTSACVPTPRLLHVEDFLDYVSNRVVPDYDIRHALEKLGVLRRSSAPRPTASKLKQAAEALDCADACGVNLPGALVGIEDNAFMIVVQDFLDPYTLNVRQLMKRCVEEITPDGRLIPFCAWNSVGYREHVRAQMSGVEMADVVPNATPLQPIPMPTRYGSLQVPQ